MLHWYNDVEPPSAAQREAAARRVAAAAAAAVATKKQGKKKKGKKKANSRSPALGTAASVVDAAGTAARSCSYDSTPRAVRGSTQAHASAVAHV